MNTTTIQFPGFPSTPTRTLFPMYGTAAAGKGFEVACMYRERTADGTTRDSGMAHLPVQSFRTQKAADAFALDLNLKVQEAIQ